MRRSDWTPHRAVDSETLCVELGCSISLFGVFLRRWMSLESKGCVTEMKSEHEISYAAYWCQWQSDVTAKGAEKSVAEA